MYTYCKLKNGEIKILWSDDIETDMMVTLIDFDQLNALGRYDPEYFTTERYPYSEVNEISTDLVYLQSIT